MSGSLGYSEQSSEQKSKAQAGLRGEYAEQLSPTVYNLATDASNLAGQYVRNPFGYFQGYNANQLLGTDNPTGLPGEFGQYLNQAANQMFSNASAGGAIRGQVTPENTAGVVGSAITNLGASVLPYVTDLAKYKSTLPESLMGSRLGYLQNTLGAIAPILGSQSTYAGSSSGYGFNMGGGVGGTP